eukprot:416699-Hanusia_phi.AAC.2
MASGPRLVTASTKWHGPRCRAPRERRRSPPCIGRGYVTQRPAPGEARLPTISAAPYLMPATETRMIRPYGYQAEWTLQDAETRGRGS